jgi:chloride channel protein, CIC family
MKERNLVSDANEHTLRLEVAATSGGVPVAPSLGPALAATGMRRGTSTIDGRTLRLAGFACLIAVVAALLAQLLTASIDLVTNLAFYGRISLAEASPAGNRLGLWCALVPVLGALGVGVMARYGSAAIRGHGIPEAMEQVLFNQSRIPARVLLLKPLSAVVSIGTGGPFGAEGPIIATGGALGSLVGQFARITAEERKTLLAAGAAAGMAATFGSPVAAVLLAIELLLFEYRTRSLVPVALAAATAAGVRVAFIGTAPAFDVGELVQPPAAALFAYVVIGALIGLLAVGVTKAVYAVEDAFERLPLHWMWWPALGAIPVGLIGIVSPRTMGVGYDNIEGMVSGDLAGTALYALCACKLISWLFSLGSGTSGGTLAPLFTVGGGAGAACAAGLAWLAPHAGIDPRLGALVGMAAMFSGASRALLASVVFAFETTRQSVGLLPLLGGCAAAYSIACLLTKHSIMTEKIARRGRPVPSEYRADYLEQVLVRELGLRAVVTLRADWSVAAARAWLATEGASQHHHGFPIIDGTSRVLGVVTRRELLEPAVDPSATLAGLVSRAAVVIAPEATLRDAADVMVRERIGRLPVIDGERLVGILTRSDLLDAHQRRLVGEHHVERVRRLPLAEPLPHGG